MRIVKISSLAAVVTVATSAMALAATLQAISGSVLVNQGAGFKPATGPTQLQVGDRVMTRAGGSAEIVYDDGCRVPVQAGSVATIQTRKSDGSLKDGRVENSPCANSASESGSSVTSDPGSAASVASAEANTALTTTAVAVGAGIGIAVIIKKLSASP